MPSHLLIIIPLVFAGMHDVYAAESVLTDCFIGDVFSSRGTCLGVCAFEKLSEFTRLYEGNGACLIIITNFIKTNCPNDKCDNFQYVYDTLLGDRSRICKLIDDDTACSKAAVKSACRDFGTTFMERTVGVVKSFLDCNNPTSLNALTCTANPSNIWNNPKYAECIQKAGNDTLITSLAGKSMANIVKELQIKRNDVCRFGKEATDCFRRALEGQQNFASYCTADIINMLQAEVDEIFKIVGCTNEGDYDALDCALKLAEEVNYNAINTKCIVPNQSFTSAFNRVDSTLVVDYTKVCPLQTMLTCMGGELKRICGEKFTWKKYDEAIKPFQDFLKYKASCSGTTRVIGKCGCYGEYSVGDAPASGTCTDSDKETMCTAFDSSSSSNPLYFGMGIQLAVGLTLLVLRWF